MMEARSYEGIQALILVIAVSAGSLVYADGYRNPPPTAEGIGKSGVNKVFVEDASAVSYNPANLADLTSGSFVLDVTLAHTESTYHGPHGDAIPDDPWQPLPNIYAATPLGQSGIVFGFGISTPYGQGSSFNKYDLLMANTNQPAPLYEAEMMVLNFNPSLAFKVGDSLSVGLGADIIYSSLDFKQHYPWPGTPGVAEADGDGAAIGGNLALTWKPVERQRVIFTYRSPFDVEYKGDFKVSNFIPSPPTPFTDSTPTSDFSTEIDFPTIIGLGYGIEITKDIRIEANLEWLEWSRNDSMTIDLANNTPLLDGQNKIPNDWDDTFTFGVGGDWQLDENWVLRAGYAFIESPIPDGTSTPILPDADRHALSLGMGYTTGSHTFDVAYTFSIYGDRTSTNPAYPGDYDIDSDLVGLTYSYSF